jgi:uncharacterized protein
VGRRPADALSRPAGLGAYPWLTPHFGVLAGVVTVLLAVDVVCVAPWRGRRGYQQLRRARARNPGALLRYYRRTARWQVALCLLVGALLLTPGLDHADVGLRWPSGPHASSAWGYLVCLVVPLAVVGVVLRYRARHGDSVPGQQVVAALLPVTAEERRWAAIVAVGAGVSEELLFRGLFIAAVVGPLGLGVWPAAIITSLMFGVVHVYQGMAPAVALTLFGLVLSWFYLLGASLIPVMLLHVAIDLRGLVLVPLVSTTAGRRH